MLPSFPGVAVLAAGGIAAYFRTGHQNRFFQWVLTVWGALLAVAGIGVIGLMVFHPFAELASKRGAIIFLGAAGVIYGAVLLWSLADPFLHVLHRTGRGAGDRRMGDSG